MRVKRNDGEFVDEFYEDDDFMDEDEEFRNPDYID